MLVGERLGKKKHLPLVESLATLYAQAVKRDSTISKCFFRGLDMHVSAFFVTEVTSTTSTSLLFSKKVTHS